jgi:serine/threonine protein kinase
MSSETLPPDIVSGRVLGHFELGDRIGSGGMGVVFKARDILLGRAVALKVLSHDLLDSDTAKKRFLREGQLAASVAHPHIATVYEIGEADGVFYIARSSSREEPRADPGWASVGGSVILIDAKPEALAAPAGNSSDVKSSNIMGMPDGGVKVLDFAPPRRVPRDRGGERGSDRTPRKGERPSTRARPEPGIRGGPQRARRRAGVGCCGDEKTDVFLGVALYEASTDASFAARASGDPER